MSKLITIPLAFVVGLLIGGAIIFAFGDKISVWVAGPYFIPNSLAYSEDSSFKDYKSQGFTVSVKDNWGVEKLSYMGFDMFFNKKKDDYYSFFIQKVEEDKTVKEYIDSFDDLPDLLKQNAGVSGNNPEVLKSKLLKINDNEAGVVFLDLGSNDLMGIIVLVNKNGQVYSLIIITTKDFYNKNRGDVKNSIASFR